MWITLEVNGKIGKCYFATYYTLQASAVDKNRKRTLLAKKKGMKNKSMDA